MSQKEVFQNQMKEAGVLIKKRPNEDTDKISIITNGATGAIYGILAYAINQIANQSEASLYDCWCMVNAIRDEIAENDKNMAIIARFEDERELYDDDSEGGLISEE